MLNDWKRYLFTITGDNGKEFAHHKAIAESLGIKFTLQDLITAGKEDQMKT